MADNNRDREARALATLRAYPEYEEEDLSSSICDLVADLLHLARQNDIEPDYIIHMSQLHYDEEVDEEADAERWLNAEIKGEV